MHNIGVNVKGLYIQPVYWFESLYTYVPVNIHLDMYSGYVREKNLYSGRMGVRASMVVVHPPSPSVLCFIGTIVGIVNGD